MYDVGQILSPQPSSTTFQTPWRKLRGFFAFALPADQRHRYQATGYFYLQRATNRRQHDVFDKPARPSLRILPDAPVRPALLVWAKSINFMVQ